MSFIHQASCVAIEERALLIEGASGSGKSSLALALIDRGAILISDDAVSLEPAQGRLLASPAPNIVGLLEIRNLGLLEFPTLREVPVSLVVKLDPAAERYIEAPETVELGGVSIPLIRLWPGGEVLAVKAELALAGFGLD
jgi:serine kinase of HPr protein (carbohydrate metabolism regulator)